MKIKLYCLIGILAYLLATNHSLGQEVASNPILQAIASGNKQLVQEQLKKVNNINVVYTTNQSSFGTTLVCAAACHGQIDIIKLLVAEGAALNTANVYIYDALKEAIKCKQERTTAWLLSQSAYKNLSKKKLKNLLYLAIGNDDISIFNLLLNKLPNLQHTNGYTSLLFSAAINHKSKIFKHLVNLGADINMDREGLYIIHMAASDVNILSYLLNQGMAVTALSEEGLTPLHFCQNPDAATFLIQQGAKINAQDHYGWTPLHYAVLDGDVNVVNILLNQKQVNKKAMTSVELETIHSKLTIKKGSTPLTIAKRAQKHYKDDLVKQKKYQQIIKWLEK